MEASYLLGFGPRTGAAIRDLSAKLYGAPAGQ
jgi:iron complex transport system substrate-binding protein